MKKILICCLISFMISSCVSDKVDKHTEAYLRERVTAIYDDVFGVYNENNTANGLSVIGLRNFEKDYCSDDFNKVLKQVLEYDEEHSKDEIGYFEGDYWIQGQDWDNLKMEIVSVTEFTDNAAKVRVNITNFGHEELVELPMVFERDDWYIDSFITFGEFGYDEKLGMKEYINY